MNKRALRLMLFAMAIVSFGMLYGNSERALAQTPTDVVASDCIYKQTASKSVIRYLRQHQRLPDCYITKREAYERGWNPGAGNLCQVLPGKAIGGDRFSNREGRLPAAENRVWREADINYRCGRRGADRLLYSNDGLIFVTRDHYRNFIRME